MKREKWQSGVQKTCGNPLFSFNFFSVSQPLIWEGLVSIACFIVVFWGGIFNLNVVQYRLVTALVEMDCWSKAILFVQSNIWIP